MGQLWNSIVKTFESYKGGSLNVTKRALILGARNDVTNWCAKGFSESTIKMAIIPRGATRLALACGAYVRLDAVGFTDTVLQEDDEVETAGGVYYEVKAVREHGLTPDIIEFYECDLTKLPLHE